MPTSITRVLKTYPRESLDTDTMRDPPPDMQTIADTWELITLPIDLLELWTSTGECRVYRTNGVSADFHQ